MRPAGRKVQPEPQGKTLRIRCAEGARGCGAGSAHEETVAQDTVRRVQHRERGPAGEIVVREVRTDESPVVHLALNRERDDDDGRIERAYRLHPEEIERYGTP